MDSSCLGGRYRIIGQLGAGGFSRTFLVEDLHLPNNPRCVIKQLKPQTVEPRALDMARRLFDTEARVLYQLGNHSQIPTLLAHFEEHKEFYLAQEYIEGIKLSWLISKYKPWSETRTVMLLQEILDILVFVHRQEVIHRDIKPSNLIRRYRDGKMVLIDFGAVKEVSSQKADPQTEITNLTVAIGTQGYMPNEQLAGKPRFSSDVYAVGMIGIRALTGVHPKHLKDDFQTGELDWHAYTSNVCPELIKVLDCMVRYDFRDRYPTAIEALEALRTVPVDPDEVISLESEFLSQMAAGGDSPEPFEDALISDLPEGYPPPLGAGEFTTSIADFEFDSAHQLAGFEHKQREPLSVGSDGSGSGSGKPGGVSYSFPYDRHPTSGRSHKSMLKQGLGALLLLLSGAALLAFRPQILSSLYQRSGFWAQASQVKAQRQLSDLPAAIESLIPPELRAADVLSEAQQLQRQGKLEAALSTYSRAIRIQPNLAAAFLGRCEILNLLDQPNLAIVACNDALAYQPNYPAALRSKGNAFEEQERLLEALELYEQAVLYDPQLASAWLDQGRILQQVGRSAEAIRALERAIALSRNSAEAWSLKGSALWHLGRYDQAIEALDKALLIQPDHPEASQLRQRARDRLGR